MRYFKVTLVYSIAMVLLLFFSLANAQTSSNLTYFIKSAQLNSPLLTDYNNQMLSTRIDSLKLRATYGFIVTAEGNASYAPNSKGWGYDNALTNGQSIFAGVRVSREFISRNNLSTRLKTYKNSIAQVLTQKDLAIQTLNRQITDQYIATYTSQKQMDLSAEIIALLSKEDLVLQKLTQKATFKQTDYLSFKVTLQQNQLALQQQTADWQNNYALLNYLSGIIDTNFHALSLPDLGEISFIPSFQESIYTKSFQADSTKLANEAMVIAYDYKPKVNAFSDGGYQSSLTHTPFKNFGMSIGLSVSLPIYNGHQKQLLLQQNNLALQTRKKYLEQTQNQYQQEVFNLQNQIRHYDNMLGMASQQIEYAKALVEANAKQLPTGDVKMVDFILSINNLLNLKANIIQYNNALYTLKNQMKYLIIQ
ncbi:TolC family protein [Sphingobacterium sp. 18053]|uniref:TolC family protein n=1 Tax=Sphingobacterium sp. 18053 TaxID=2681401 RepID=UPI00135ADF20|nr:TolC family protein [Sphingobacterium sp. 18053]